MGCLALSLLVLLVDNYVSRAVTRVCGADVQLPTGVEAPGSNRLAGPVHAMLPLMLPLNLAACSATTGARITQLLPATAFPTLAVVGVADPVSPSHVTRVTQCLSLLTHSLDQREAL